MLSTLLFALAFLLPLLVDLQVRARALVRGCGAFSINLVLSRICRRISAGFCRRSFIIPITIMLLKLRFPTQYQLLFFLLLVLSRGKRRIEHFIIKNIKRTNSEAPKKKKKNLYESLLVSRIIGKKKSREILELDHISQVMFAGVLVLSLSRVSVILDSCSDAITHVRPPSSSSTSSFASRINASLSSSKRQRLAV